MIKGESYLLKSLRIKASEYDSCKENRTPFTVEQYKSKLLIDYIDKLQNNWNELKKWLEDNRYDKNYESYRIEDYTKYRDVLNKMQELEQGKDG